MKFALICAKGPQDLDQYHPLGLFSIAAWLKARAAFVDVSYHEDISSLIDSKPDVVGISSVTQNFDIARSWSRKIKSELDATVILGGAHITCLPKSLPASADFGVIGEGEKTIVELLIAINEGKQDFGEIDGICFRKENEIFITGPKMQIDNLDLLPISTQEITGSQKEFHIMTSRGCPYRCLFCSAKTMWGKFRAHSTRRIVDQIKILHKKCNASRIHVYDDLFVADRMRFFDFVELYEKTQLREKIRLSAAVRANLVDDDLCKGLVRTGIREVTFGAESADNEILKDNKPGITVSLIEDSLKVLAEYDIGVSISMIVGFPGQAPESMRKTYGFIAEQMLLGRLSGAEVHVLAPFPGTDYYRPGLDKGQWADFGRPWHGLILNESFSGISNELVGYDRAMRILFLSIKKPCIALVENPKAEELMDLSELFLFRAVYGVSPTNEARVIQKGDTDVAILPSESIEEIFRSIDSVPVLILKNSEEIRASHVRGALFRFYASGKKEKVAYENIQVVSSERWNENSKPVHNDVMDREPLNLLSFEETPKGNFVKVLDEHANWIQNLTGGRK